MEPLNCPPAHSRSGDIYTYWCVRLGFWGWLLIGTRSVLLSKASQSHCTLDQASPLLRDSSAIITLCNSYFMNIFLPIVYFSSTFESHQVWPYHLVSKCFLSYHCPLPLITLLFHVSPHLPIPFTGRILQKKDHPESQVPLFHLPCTLQPTFPSRHWNCSYSDHQWCAYYWIWWILLVSTSTHSTSFSSLMVPLTLCSPRSPTSLLTSGCLKSFSFSFHLLVDSLRLCSKIFLPSAWANLIHITAIGWWLPDF